MIEEIGVDIVENDRMAHALATPHLPEKILTPTELAEYHKRQPTKSLEYICGRFAAKEAIIKALHHHFSPHYLEIEILENSDGSPRPCCKNYNIKLSISHERHYTVATAILLGPC